MGEIPGRLTESEPFEQPEREQMDEQAEAKRAAELGFTFTRQETLRQIERLADRRLSEKGKAGGERVLEMEAVEAEAKRIGALVSDVRKRPRTTSESTSNPAEHQASAVEGVVEQSWPSFASIVESNPAASQELKQFISERASDELRFRTLLQEIVHAGNVIMAYENEAHAQKGQPDANPPLSGVDLKQLLRIRHEVREIEYRYNQDQTAVVNALNSGDEAGSKQALKRAQFFFKGIERRIVKCRLDLTTLQAIEQHYRVS